MKVIIKPFFGAPREWPLERITKKWIVIRYNDVATGKYSRETGYEAGAFKGRGGGTPSKVLNLVELNELAGEGVYEPKKSLKLSG